MAVAVIGKQGTAERQVVGVNERGFLEAWRQSGDREDRNSFQREGREAAVQFDVTCLFLGHGQGRGRA